MGRARTSRSAKSEQPKLVAQAAGADAVRPIRPSPRSKGQILVGISAWTEPTLIKRGNFYPKGVTTAEGRLKFYASQFPIAEVDSSYYFPPSERNSELWIERTPPDFTFNIKAYSLLTNHPTKLESLYKDLRQELPEELTQKRNIYREHLPGQVVDEVWQRFADALLPLHSAGKLGAVLFQFPPWFVIGRASKAYLLECKERMKDYRIAVEFRHKSWMEGDNQEETLDFLREHDLPCVCVDMPQGFDSSLPPLAVVTSEELAMVRFHGRDPEIWEKKAQTAAERFRYDYSQRELGEWAPKVGELASQARETHVIMNNCYNDYAVRNARQLASLLE
jgi:uncharacterized protein YecE (DUF72 family)